MSWNGSENKIAAPAPKNTAKTPPSKWRGLAALVIVVAAGSLAAWFFLRSDEDSEGTEVRVKADRIGEVQHAPGAQDDSAQRMERAHNAKKRQHVEEDASVEGTAGAAVAAVADSMPTSEPPKPVLEASSDQIIAMATSVPPGGMLCPVPVSDADEKVFLRNINTPIEIEEGDSDAVVAMKRRVMDTRLQIVELMKDGASFKDVITQHRELLNDNAKMRSDCIKEARAFREAGDDESARKYVEKVNEVFRQSGIDEIELPLTLEERRELAMQRALERKKNKEKQGEE